MSNSLWPHESQDARPPCPSPTLITNSRPSSQWCHPTISSSVVPFSSCPQSPPASESFPMSQLFTWGGQSTGVSALASFLKRDFPRIDTNSILLFCPAGKRQKQTKWLVFTFPLISFQKYFPNICYGLPRWLHGNESVNVGDSGDSSLNPGSGRSLGLGGGNGSPLQYSCLEKSYGQRSLEGYSPWGCKESDTTEQLSTWA